MIGEGTNHLWHSTWFAAAAGLLTVAFRKNRAQVRYWLWFSASFKFFVPWALLISLGSRLGWAPAARKIATQIAAPAVSFTMERITQPFSGILSPAPSPSGPADWAPIAILGVWVCGFAGVALLRLRGWLRIRDAVRASTAVDIPATVEIRASPGLLEPGVVGWLRPILLLPAGIVERLTPPQLEAVLAHELCHVRRRDNLFASLHMIVEAVFWFHPLVWWIGARLVEERERACDEEVLSLGSLAHVYAEAILNVCKMYVESPLVCVSGVTGSNLKKRIEVIMANRTALRLHFAKKIALAVAGMAAIAVPIVVGAMNAPSIQAQSPQAKSGGAATPKFEVVSIKPCQAVGGSSGRDFPGTVLLRCATVARLIWEASGPFANGHMNPLASVTVAGGPAWLTSDLYEIDAKTAAPQIQATMNGPMLQALLEDRFKVRVHRETRKVPVYVLTVAQGGHKLRPFQGTCIPRDWDHATPEPRCETPQRTTDGWDFNGATMADLRMLFLIALDRPVIDETGLAGRFSYHLELADEPFGNRPRGLLEFVGPAAPAIEPSLISQTKTAVMKLGLNLEPAERPGEFLVIDHVERPSRN
jgi:bla regulator protein BlaR1